MLDNAEINVLLKQWTTDLTGFTDRITDLFEKSPEQERVTCQAPGLKEGPTMLSLDPLLSRRLEKNYNAADDVNKPLLTPGLADRKFVKSKLLGRFPFPRFRSSHCLTLRLYNNALKEGASEVEAARLVEKFCGVTLLGSKKGTIFRGHSPTLVPNFTYQVDGSRLIACIGLMDMVEVLLEEGELSDSLSVNEQTAGPILKAW